MGIVYFFPLVLTVFNLLTNFLIIFHQIDFDFNYNYFYYNNYSVLLLYLLLLFLTIQVKIVEGILNICRLCSCIDMHIQYCYLINVILCSLLFLNLSHELFFRVEYRFIIIIGGSFTRILVM